MSATHPAEHRALTAALVTGSPDLGNMFSALEAMSTSELRRFATATEWLAMHARGELDNRNRAKDGTT